MRPAARSKSLYARLMLSYLTLSLTLDEHEAANRQKADELQSRLDEQIHSMQVLASSMTFNTQLSAESVLSDSTATAA